MSSTALAHPTAAALTNRLVWLLATGAAFDEAFAVWWVKFQKNSKLLN